MVGSGVAMGGIEFSAYQILQQIDCFLPIGLVGGNHCSISFECLNKRRGLPYLTHSHDGLPHSREGNKKATRALCQNKFDLTLSNQGIGL